LHAIPLINPYKNPPKTENAPWRPPDPHISAPRRTIRSKNVMPYLRPSGSVVPKFQPDRYAATVHLDVPPQTGKYSTLTIYCKWPSFHFSGLEDSPVSTSWADPSSKIRARIYFCLLLLSALRCNDYHPLCPLQGAPCSPHPP
jgi:hypothetical protein